MIKIDCNECTNHCCGGNPHLTPVLLPSEEAKFKQYARSVKTPFREVWVLAKKGNGNCIFLNDRTTRCSIYEERPLECRLYPFLLDFRQESPNAELDQRFCPHIRTVIADKKGISALVQEIMFPEDWINAYKSLEDC